MICAGVYWLHFPFLEKNQMSSTQYQLEIIERRVTDSGEIQLQQRTSADDTAFEIISDGVFLMASYNQTSERALARQAMEAVETEGTGELRILVGGLGMGLTLQECQICAAKLGYARADIQIDVVEISDAIVEWNRTHLALLNGRAPDHSSVRLTQADLYDFLKRAPASTYDVIVLDVDNGPSWPAHEQNGRLYSIETLGSWRNCLKSGGVLAVWSAQPEPAFLTRMRSVFGEAVELAVEAPHLREAAPDDFIYLAVKKRQRSPSEYRG